MALELSQFETLIHICVLANLLYAVSDVFSDKLFPLIFEPFRDKFTVQHTRCSQQLTKLVSEHDVDSTKLFLASFKGITDAIDDFDSSHRNNTFSMKFRSLYLLGGLYAFLLLVHAGLEQFLSRHEQVECIIFYSNLYVLGFYIYAFRLTFFKEKEKIRTFFVLINFAGIFLFQLVTYLCTFLNHFHWIFFQFWFGYRCMTDSNCVTLFALFVIILPILLHILRAVILLWKDSKSIGKDLEDFEQVLVTMSKQPATATHSSIAQTKNTILSEFLKNNTGKGEKLEE